MSTGPYEVLPSPASNNCVLPEIWQPDRKGCCKYLVMSHVISPPLCCSPPPRAYGNPALVWMLAENAMCQMGANSEPQKSFVLGLSLGSEFKTSSKAMCSS